MKASHVVALMLAASLSGCGGYSAPTAPSGGGQMSSPAPPGSMTVTIQDFSFSPATLTIKAGTTVHWMNNGPSAHTTTSDAGVWNSGTLSGPGGGGVYGGGSSAGGTFDFTFTQAGTFPYHCSLHPPTLYPGFTGTITVTP
jgi:plastocyanin